MFRHQNSNELINKLIIIIENNNFFFNFNLFAFFTIIYIWVPFKSTNMQKLAIPSKNVHNTFNRICPNIYKSFYDYTLFTFSKLCKKNFMKSKLEEFDTHLLNVKKTMIITLKVFKNNLSKKDHKNWINKIYYIFIFSKFFVLKSFYTYHRTK